jgi:hypothetical protein
MKKIFKISLFFSSIILVFACKDNNVGDTAPANNSDNYFNYSLNSKLYYKGDSIIYNDFNNSIDTIEFSYKDSVVGVDTIGDQIVYQFERFISYDDVEYKYLKNYSINRSKSVGIIKNEDLRNNYLLPYLFTKDSKWNGNQYQLGIYQEYYIDSLGTVIYASGTRKKVKVIQLDEKNLIEEYKTEEHYVEGIGMVYGYYKSINKDISTAEIKSGSIVILAHEQ